MAVVLRRRINTLVSSVFIRAGPEKKKPEDAYFTSERSIAVADGVGGWAESGIDPAKFSRALCKNITGLCAYDDVKYMMKPV